MSYIGQQLPADTFSGFVTDAFTGDGSATTFTLSKAPFSENTLIVVINNVIQRPTTNFTVSGTTLTIVGTAVASGDVIYAIHLGGPVASTLASKVDVNGLSDGIILDADADTTISADTDDQIDVKIGGTDALTVTGTALTGNALATIGAAGTASTVAGIPLFSDTSNGSIYTHDVSGTDNTAANNTAFGLNALDAITTGDNNIAIGKDAGTSLNTGSSNVFIGYEAGKDGQTVLGCTFVGEQAGRANTEDSNTGIGRDALYTNTTGRFNVAVGDGALTTMNDTGSLDEADFNVAVGYQALSNLTTGYKTVAIGYQAGNRGTTTRGSCYVGYQTYGSQTGNGGNNYFGNSSAQAMEGGYYNNGHGTAVHASITSGYSNIAIGHDAGYGITSGFNNIHIGYKTGAGGGDREYAILIGHGDGINAFPDGGANTIRMGKRTSYISNTFTSNATWSHSSDERYKKDIQDNTNCGLDFINELRPITYKWKAPSELDTDLPEYDKDKTEADYTKKNYGLIAQEVKAALDKLSITDFEGWRVDPEHAKDRQEVSEQMFVYPLIKAVQELSAKVKALEDA